MKIFTLILFVILIILVRSSINTNQNYNMKINVCPKISQPYFIQSIKKQSFLFCLADCNSNPNCLTIVFQKSADNSNPGTCILYSKIFQDTDLIISMDSKIVRKNKSRYFITFDNFNHCYSSNN